MFRYSILTFALLITLSTVTLADTATVYPTDDAAVTQNNPDNNYGSYYLTDVGETSGFKRNSFFKFDLSAYSGVTLNFANCYLYICDYENEFPPDQTWIARNTSDWDEDTLTWNNRPGYTGWYTWTPNMGWWVIAMRDWAQGWIDGTYHSYGFQIGANIPGAATVWFSVYTKEWTGETYDPYLHLGWPTPVESTSLGEIKAAFK
ncbi:MAG: DNRLRE domain-containing protein [bacterium]|nr:DNRLRE domain-containing protein [bacterium]